VSFFRRKSSRFANYGGFAPYVPVAQRRAQAAKTAAKATKSGVVWSPVTIQGRKIATTFWGQAWCDHLESYSDYENRLPRGRTYVRNGSVVDLQIVRGQIVASVQGSSLYRGTITIQPLAAARWNALKRACAGQITSLVSLLQGRFPENVLRLMTDRATGLFPAPGEIKLGCSCPDSASLCKHLAAVLYGVGARLDTQPELLFLLRGVDHQELISEAVAAATQVPAGAGDSAPLDDAELADVFGIEIGASPAPSSPTASSAPATPNERPPSPTAAPVAGPSVSKPKKKVSPAASSRKSKARNPQLAKVKPARASKAAKPKRR